MLDQLLSWVKQYPDYRNISKIIESEKAHGGIIASIYIMVFATFLTFLSSLLSYIISSYFVPTTQFTFAAIFLVLLKSSMVAFVVLYALFAILFIIAILFGGKGSFSSQLYVLAIFLFCNNIYSFVFKTFSRVPQLSFPFQIILSLIGLYGVFAQIQSIGKIHNLSILRSVAVYLLWGVVYVLITIYVLGVITGSHTV